VITLAVGISLNVIVQMLLGIPVAGSVALFLAGVVIYLFFATAIGIFLATVARTMPQLGLLYLLAATPMNILSGSNTPLESISRLLQIVIFRLVRSGDSLPRRGPRRGVARVLGCRAYGKPLLRPRNASLSPGFSPDGLKNSRISMAFSVQ
jgi:hypothetical protein